MIGAIIGDIVGSRFEFDNYKSKDFELFTKECHITDDTVMTLAIAKAIMETDKLMDSSLGFYEYNKKYYEVLEKMTIKYMQDLGRKYRNHSYGGTFIKWIFSNNPKAYNSFGNGAAMRISPVGFIVDKKEDLHILSEVITSTTHNHPEGIKGAEATAMAIFLGRRGCDKEKIRSYIKNNYYNVDFSLEKIRDTYRGDTTCQGSIPQAIGAFLESISFKDAIRNAISLGGDNNTLVSITGGISEGYYGVSEEFKEIALSYLDNELRGVYEDWCKFLVRGK